MSIGKFIEEAINQRKIAPNQIIAYYNFNGNLDWLGKAEFAPIYLDWAEMSCFEKVGNELRIYELN